MNPKDIIHESWGPIKDIIDNDENLTILNKRVLPLSKYYPERDNIFRVFEMPLKDIKVVIIGQDPYPNEHQAIGYAFAVPETVSKPFSLRVIEKEVGHEIDRTLSGWREQGVFLLNTALTVEAKRPGSHAHYWAGFTEEVVRYIARENPCIWLLWGRKALAYSGIIGAYDGNLILPAPHPAAEAYNRGGASFVGCEHFKIVNEVLESKNEGIIKW